MKEIIDWDRPIAFTGYISQPKYSHISVPVDLTYRELFVIIGILMLTCKHANSIRYDLGETIFGREDPCVFLRDFDYNQILLTFNLGGMIDFIDSDSEEGTIINLTEAGKKFLYDNRTIAGIEFCEKKRQETRTIIEFAKKKREGSNLKRTTKS